MAWIEPKSSGERWPIAPNRCASLFSGLGPGCNGRKTVLKHRNSDDRLDRQTQSEPPKKKPAGAGLSDLRAKAPLIHCSRFLTNRSSASRITAAAAVSSFSAARLNATATSISSPENPN
jgi:hypothetical protein